MINKYNNHKHYITKKNQQAVLMICKTVIYNNKIYEMIFKIKTNNLPKFINNYNTNKMLYPINKILFHQINNFK